MVAIKGFGYRIEVNKLRNGNTSYRAVVRYKGVYGGSQTFKLRNEAIQWANRETQKIDRARGGMDDIGEADTMTFSQACDLYIASPEAIAQKGHQVIMYRSNTLKRASFAGTPLLNIRPKMIREFRDKRTNDGMAPQTI